MAEPPLPTKPPADDIVADQPKEEKPEEPKKAHDEVLQVKEEEDDVVESTRLSLSNLLNPKTWDLPGWESGNPKYVLTCVR